MINQVRRRGRTLMVRSGGRAQAMELCLEARLLAERLAASRRSEPKLSALSMRSDWSASQGRESRSLSRERSREREGESAKSRNAARRSSMEGGRLGFWEEREGQGRLAIDGWTDAMVCRWWCCCRSGGGGGGGYRHPQWVDMRDFGFGVFWEKESTDKLFRDTCLIRGGIWGFWSSLRGDFRIASSFLFIEHNCLFVCLIRVRQSFQDFALSFLTPL